MEITITTTRTEEHTIKLPRFFRVIHPNSWGAPHVYCINEEENSFVDIWRNSMVEVLPLDGLRIGAECEVEEISEEDFMDAYRSALRLFKATISKQ